MIDLGLHNTDCLGKVELCPNGMTLSFWFKTSVHVSPYVRLVASPSITIDIEPTDPIGSWLYINLNDDIQGYYFEGEREISHDTWHNIVFTYSALTKFDVFIDGCPLTKNMVYYNSGGPDTEEATRFQLGCYSGSKCARITYDDLRLWNVLKDKYFIWHLWNN